MKLKSLYKGLFITFFALLSVSCDDNLRQVGFTIQPERDRLAVGVDTLLLEATTVQVDSVFSKTNYPVLGEYIDPVFGSIKSEYIGEFYLSPGAEFKESAVIDSVRAVISYTTMMGDSLSPMRLSIYEVTESLKGINNYTHINPEVFANMSAPLGSCLFTGKNVTHHTETYSSGYTAQELKVYDINVQLPKSIGENFLAEYKKEGHGKLANADTFREYFPGLYFTTSFGNSTILSINLTSLDVHYHYTDKEGSSKGTDTIRTSKFRLNITPEVTQINHVENKNEQLLVENNDYTYVKTPAGVFTKITFPLSRPYIHEKLKSQALNLANFTVYAMPDALEDPMVKLNPPEYLLLVNEDSLAGFFENRKLKDDVTSFLSDPFDRTTYSYQFNNISTMINHYNEKNRESGGKPFDLTYYLIPVDATFTTVQTSYYGGSSQVLTAIHNQMWPTAAILDKRKGNLKVELIFSNF
jgi:hypothetical protein